jgi:CRP-like cAMP-binding protein
MSAPRIAAARAGLSSRLLEGLAPAEMQAILSAAKQRRFLAKSVITNQGNPAEHMFLLTKGRVRFFYTTQEGQKLLMLWLTPGEVFGGAALLSTPVEYIMSVEAVRDSTALVWDRAMLRRLAETYPRLLENGLMTAWDYLHWYTAAHVALTCHTARQRLAHVLICLSRAIGHPVAGGVELDVTNEELASSANITPFTTSRLLSEWRRNRAVEKHRGKIVLRSPERLFLHTV